MQFICVNAGRGLEKFLRRNSYSSDERDNSTPITTKSRNKTKSLESLTDNKKEAAKSPKLSPKQPKEDQKEEQPRPMEHAKVVVKQSGEKVDKKKSQFNYESVIEITLPSAPLTQPCPALDISREKPPTEEKLEEPITPIICHPVKPKIPTHNNMSPESVVSNKHPMEWDSFIPVSVSPPVAINNHPFHRSAFYLLLLFILLGLRVVSTATLPVMQSDGAGRQRTERSKNLLSTHRPSAAERESGGGD